MAKDLHDIILNATGADRAVKVGVVQRLWRGYGEIVRYGLSGGAYRSVIVKHVRLPDARGADQSLSHRRKVRSYQVETAWYRQWSRHCDTA